MLELYVLHCLKYLANCSPAGGTSWVNLGGVALQEEIHH